MNDMNEKKSILGICIIALGALAAWVPDVGAFSQWSNPNNQGNCAACHGDFEADNYVSFNDGTPWGTSLHNGHLNTMLSGDCSYPDDNGKYMATSSGANECSNGHPWLVYPTFSYYFFLSLKNGSSLEDAFAYAYSQVVSHYPDQHPQERDCAPKGNHEQPTFP